MMVVAMVVVMLVVMLVVMVVVMVMVVVVVLMLMMVTLLMSGKIGKVRAETGRGFVFFPALVSGQGASAQRLNVTCPLEDWAALEAAAAAAAAPKPAPLLLLPCGTATVTTGEQLLDALTRLQETHQRLLITLAANITLPPTTGASSSSAAASRAGEGAVAGAGGSSGSSSGSSVVLVGNDTLMVSEPSTAENAGGANSSSGGSSSSSSGSNQGRVVMVFSDLSIVNIPAGPRSTWPTGLLGNGMWHVGMDRRKDAPVQLIHLRMGLIFSAGQVKYFSYWYTRSVSLVAEERASAVWVLGVITPPVQIFSPIDGSPTLFGLTGSYIEKYNVTATSIPFLTPPPLPPVDLWSVGEPPVMPDSIGFVSSAADLVSELSVPWTGPRVIVLLANITLDKTEWPKEGFQMAAGLTLSGPSVAASIIEGPRTTLNAGGMNVARAPPGMTVSFRNLRVFNASVPISWALPQAPSSLPGFPGYDLWRARCLPDLMDDSAFKLEMHGCQVEVPELVFVLLQMYNNLQPCSPTATAAAAADLGKNCTAVTGAAVRLSSLQTQLGNLFERLFRATGKFTPLHSHSIRGWRCIEYTTKGSQPLRSPSIRGWRCIEYTTKGSQVSLHPSIRGWRCIEYTTKGSQVSLQQHLPTSMADRADRAIISHTACSHPVTQPDASTMLFLSHTLTALSMNTTTFRVIPSTMEDLKSEAGSESGAGGSLSGPLTTCNIQTLITLLMDAPGNAVAASTGPSPSPSTGAVQNHALTGGIAAGGALGIVIAFAAVALVVRRLRQRRRRLTWHGSSPSPKAGVPPAAAPVPLVGMELDGVGEASSGPAGGGGGGGGGGDGCSAFSMSFAAADQVPGKAATMLELLLDRGAMIGPISPPPPPQQLPLQQQQQLQPHHQARPTPHGGRGGVDAIEGRGINALPAGAGAGPLLPVGAAVGLPGIVGRGKNDANANDLNNGNGNDNVMNNNDNNNPNHNNNSSRGSSLSANVQRTLAGAIDGMIRKYEASGSGGEWRGLPVAIKVVLLQEGDSAARRERLVREVALSATLSHPNVVPTYHYTVQPVAVACPGGGSCGSPGVMGPGIRPRITNRPAPRDAGAPAADAAVPAALVEEADGGVTAYKLSIFMAYCDGGTLRDALRDGVFKKPWPPSALAPYQQVTGPAAAAAAAVRRQQQQHQGAAVAPPLPAAGAGPGVGVGVAEPDCLGVPHHLQQPQLGQGLAVREGAPPPLRRVLQEHEAAAAAAAAAVAAVGAVPSEAASLRSLRPPTGGAGREGRLESWQDLRAAPNQALALFAALDVARGLDYLHACNVVHGDLSLQNILLASTEPVFPDAAINASTSSSAVFAAAAAALASHGGGPSACGGGGAAVAAAAAGTTMAARVMHGVADRLPQNVSDGSTSSDVTAAAATATAVATATAAAAAAAPGCCPPNSVTPPSRPSPPPPPAAPVPQRARLATGAAAGGGGGASSADTAPAVSTDEDAEAVAGTYSTFTQSGTLGGFSLSTEEVPAVSAASVGGGGVGGGRVMPMAQRVILVNPLLGQVFKISDFGLSVRLENDETHRSGLHQGTPYYTATEVLVSGKVSPAADIYSYGVCLWCLAHGVSLCQLRHLLPPMFTPVAPTLLGHLVPELNPGLRSLIRRCLSGDPPRRPTAAALVSELHMLVQAVLGPELSPLLLGAERRELAAGRTVTGSLWGLAGAGGAGGFAGGFAGGGGPGAGVGGGVVAKGDPGGGAGGG
ncbi:hypothetical protein VOLCADRAFT_100428 [Volvox carteri f. nagariensis]|uniref:Protein kinase domain-containing protein n=1 Tax=Volvox carteri f. nagariensis TaxID=3068 RepID=D8UK68_VOLCA|nr:uncharacterized protein VOLCADRAFT_100428 [Volvox carteri f. nagariensis]EFJ39881.1 hypothetical protein VOLCADRAFT_100428 [Volvox carteri f. nagariensis]|eukprot:XP_002959058.1 hypothetical protein VOLCADRAFT_100428 [Volvox carteri f. nagariensis]